MNVQVGGRTVTIQVQSSGLGAALALNRDMAVEVAAAAASAEAAAAAETGAGEAKDDAEAAAAQAAATLAASALKAANLLDLPVASTATTISLYTNEATGNDTTGDGSAGTPFATVNRALEAVPLLTSRANVRIIVTGDVTTSYRSASDMIRPALVYIDGVKIGKRTDIPSGVVTGGLVIDLSDAVLKPSTAFPRGIYATGGCGSVGIVLGETDPQAGAQSLIVAHRGAYLHVYGGATGATADGKSICALGLVAEAGGLMETVDISATGSTTDMQVYGFRSAIQMSAPGTASTVGTVSIGPGGEGGITTGMTVSTSITMRGGALNLAGSSTTSVVVSGAFDGQGGIVSGSYVNFTGTAASVVARAQLWKIDALKFDCQLSLEGGAYILRSSTSYTTGTQSTHAIPVLYSAGTYVDSTGSTWKGSSGLSPVAFDPTDRYQSVSVTANSQTISVKAVAGKRNFVVLSTTANRTGCKVDVTMYGDAASAPNTATELIFLNLSGFTVQLVNSAPNNLYGIINSSIYIGNATGAYPSAGFVWQTTYGTGGGWYCVTPQIGRETGYTAKTGTALKGAIAAYAAGAAITAPTGGATIDAESRTAIGTLITRLATVEAALQNESQRAKAYEDTLRGLSFIN